MSLHARTFVRFVPVAALVVACGATNGGTLPENGASAGSASITGGSGGSGTVAGAGGATAGLGGGPAGEAGLAGGGASTAGSGAGGSGAGGGFEGGGAAGASGTEGGAGASGGGAGASTCVDPTPQGSLDLPNVGTAPTGVTQADLAGASPATHYFASVPGGLPPAGTSDPARQVGLFLVFNEHGSNPGVEIPSVATSLRNLGHAGDFVVLGLPIDPNTTTHPYTTADHDRARQLLAYALRTWPINPRRVYLWGRGEGATMAHQFGTENKTAIAAMITYSWGWDSRNWPSNAAGDQPDLYLVIGLADYPDTHVPLVRRVYGYAKAAGFHILYREVPGLTGPTAGAKTNDDAIAWAIAGRHKKAPLSAAETALLAPHADALAARGVCPDAAIFAGVERVGGLAAGSVISNFLGAELEESRRLAERVSARSNFGDEAATALGAQLGNPSATVRKEAITALGVQSNWRNAGAQRALVDFVGNAAADPTERGLGVDAIGVAVKFQIGGDVATGGYQDPPLFQALVSLLSDPDAGLRRKAFAVLSPAMASTYDPGVSPSSQQAAISAWQTWVASLRP